MILYSKYLWYPAHHGFDVVTQRWQFFKSFCTLFLLCPRQGCEVLRSACPYVCLFPLASQRPPHIETSRNFLYLLPEAVAPSSSDDSEIRCVLPVLWMTSYLPIIGQAKPMPVVRVLSDSPGDSTVVKRDVYDSPVRWYVMIVRKRRDKKYGIKIRRQLCRPYYRYLSR